MEHAIPSLIIGALLLVASAFTAQGNLRNYDRMGQSLKQMELRLGENAQAHFTIADATLDPAGDTLSVSLRNDGQTRLALYDRVDVIVSYATALGPSRAWLPYTPAVLDPNSWTLASIADDSFEPGLLNPGETGTLLIELSPAAVPGGTHRIVIASETGAVASAPFTS
jgi:hypothetical protein